MRVGIRHIENKGIGYNTGYSTLETFLAPSPDSLAVMPFLDFRGHIFDDGRWAANGGMGLRKIGAGRVNSLYAYYDFRNTKRRNYNQISLGLETLGTSWDLRVNGYAPIGGTKSSAYDLAFDHFAGHNLVVSRKFEYALGGANGEIGGHLFKAKSFDLYMAAGPYYLKGKLGGGIFGGETRLRGTYKTWLGLEVNYSYDHTFKNIVQGQVMFNIPFGPRTRPQKERSTSCSENESLYARMVQPIIRNEIIPVDDQTQNGLAIDPSTGEPYTFWFVDNTSHSAGTYESPFSTLADAESASGTGHIIYVFPGDLTTTGLDAGITLQDNQKLWGSAVSHAISTTFGSLKIPSLSPSSLFVEGESTIDLALAPVITNTGGGNVVTLANNNEVSGFYIQNLTGHGITGSSVSGVSVTNCIIQGPDTGQTAVYGVNLSDITGTALIDSNLIFQGITGVNISATDVQDASYIISNNDAPCIALVNDADYGNFLITSYTNCENLSTTISGNSFTTSNASVSMGFTNTTSGLQACSVAINNNTIDADGASSTDVMNFTLSDYADVNLSVTNNTLDTPYGIGVAITQNNSSQLDLVLDGNTFISWYSSLSVTLNSSAQLSGSISNNDLLFDALSGILITANDSSTIPSLSITNNDITGVLETYDISSDAISITLASGSATGSFTIASNFIQAGADGINISTGSGSNVTASITDNTLSHCQLYGMELTTDGAGAIGNWTIDQNTIIAIGSGLIAGSTGAVLITAESGSTTNLSFTNNLAAPIYPVPTSSTGTYQFVNSASTFNLTSYTGNTGALTGP